MKYLMLDHGGVLDGEIQEGKPGVNDLLLQDVGEGSYQVLRNGVLIVNKLNELVKNYGYQIVFHSQNAEDDQIRILRQLCVACRAKGIEFPSIAAMAVRDPERYKGITSDKPLIITDREHGIKIAAYDVEKNGKACVREALSVMLGLKKISRHDSIVFDDSAPVIQQAESEGYQAKKIGNLEIALDEVLQKERRLTQALESKEDIESKSEVIEQKNEGDTVALLDVDHTLIGEMNFFTGVHQCKSSFEQSCALNKTLLASLKKSGIGEIYLFTDMNASPSDIFFRFMLVKYLESEGFKVSGVVTPPDIFIDRANEEQLEQMEKRFNELGKGKGRLSAQDQQVLYAEQKAIAANLLAQKEAALAPGAMFSLAIKAYLGKNYTKYLLMTFQELLESDFQLNVTSQFAQYIQENSRELNWLRVKVDHLKGLADNAIQGQHSKGLMYKELVKRKNIKKVFYADDHIGAVESVKTQAGTMPNVGTSICYIPRADKSRDPAYHDAYYELSREHYDFSAQSAKSAQPGMLIIMDKKAAATINKVYEQVLTMTQSYIQEHDGLEEKSFVLTNKKQLLRDLQADLTNPHACKYKQLENFVQRLVREGHNKLNQHRTDTWKRYVANFLSVVTVLPALGRLAHSCYKYHTPKFWKPQSEKVKIFALNECAKLKIKPF